MDIRKSVKIEIICPNKHCGKCSRMRKRIEEVNQFFGGNLDIHEIDNPRQWEDYPTWIAPALFLNGEPVARGYVPGKEYLIARIRQILHR